MDSYLKYYLNDGSFLRMKNYSLVDYYISDSSHLYLQLKYIEGFEHESEFYPKLDSDIGDFVLQLTCPNSPDLLSILTAFQHYISELSPVTLLFNQKGFFEILDHNGADHEEGWMSDFANFNFEHFTIFSEIRPYQATNWISSKAYNAHRPLLQQIQEQGIPAYQNDMSALKFEQIDRILKFGIINSLPEIIMFLNGYYLERPDMENMKAQHGASFDLILAVGLELRNEIQSLIIIK